MKRHRASRRSGELTSLVDVLFILLFAAIVQQQRQSARAAAPEPIAGPTPGPAPDSAAHDPHETAREVAERLDTDEVVFVAVDTDGRVVSIESGEKDTIPDLRLLEPTADARVIEYVPRRSPQLRICRVVERSLGGAGSIADALVLVSTDRPVRALPYALVRGLRDDVSRCPDDARARALLVPASPADRSSEEDR